MKPAYFRDMFGWFKKSNPETDPSDPLAGFSDDEIQTAALDLVHPLPAGKPSWYGGTVKECDRALEQIVALRTKYAEYQPARMRRAILGWLDYAEREVMRDRADCVSGKSKRDLDAHSAREEQVSARSREVLAALKEKS